MFASLRRQYAELVTSGAYVVLLFAGIHFESQAAWRVILGLIAFLSLVFWYAALKRLRIITGTPTSRIASAAQGYVELIGDGRFYDDSNRLISKLRQLPCLWYRYRVEEKNSNNDWNTSDSGESSEPFRVDDGSGTCIIDPRGAEIITQHKDQWIQGRYRYTEWKLIGSDTIYTLGEFKTVGGSTSTITHKELVNQVLTEWKMDNDDLLKRFDLNQNGLLDMDEWMLARQAAKREASKRLDAARAETDTNFLMRPHDGRLFLISNLSPDKLASKYYWWTWMHLVIFFGSLGGSVWLSQNT